MATGGVRVGLVPRLAQEPSPSRSLNSFAGLYNYFRDYDPQTGRYVQSDPIGLAGGLNPFGYALQNPLGLADALGLAPDPMLAIAERVAGIPQSGQADFAAIGKALYQGASNIDKYMQSLNRPTTPTQFCATPECKAGLLPAKMDLRTQCEIEKSGCRLRCQIVATPVTFQWNKMLGGNLVTGIGIFGPARREFCDWVCD